VPKVLVATAVEALGQAAPTMIIGIDETSARSVRWFFKETGRTRSDPWMTSIVDLDPAHPVGIIGLTPGRSGSCAGSSGTGPSDESIHPEVRRTVTHLG
jgi:transposase